MLVSPTQRGLMLIECLVALLIATMALVSLMQAYTRLTLAAAHQLAVVMGAV